MEFQLEESFVTDNGLTDDQVTAIKGFVENDYTPTIKKDYDGLANDNAEKIIDGAIKRTQEKFGFEIERAKGEKQDEYLERVQSKVFEKQQAQLAAKQKEIDEKLANFKGGEEYKQQIEALKQEKDDLQKQVAEFEPLKGLDEKYNTAVQELVGLKKQTAFNSVRPNFPETVNTFEADAKWGNFVKSVEEKYNIEIVDGKPLAIDKENHHKQVQLSELLKENKEIQDLLIGRQQGGPGAKPQDLQKIEGVPFDVPKGATNEEKSKIVRDHLLKTLGSATHKDFASKFQEIYSKITKAAVAA